MRVDERHDEFGRPGHGVGDVLREQYRLEAHLAEGGMGLLFRARHLKLERDVAVKLLHPRLASDRETVRRFEREIELAKVLSHPHVAQVHDFGRTEGGTLFIVMEYLEGRDLEQVLAEQGALSVDRACDVALQTLDGLAEAHDHDFIHRDLKPSNIFLSDRRRGGDHVTLLDFGVAKSLDGARHSVTQTGVICGTPMYIPPESLFERDPGKTGDVYAAGLILIEMMAGERLVDAGGLAETLEQHVCQPTPVPAPLAGTDLGEVLVEATSKAASARFVDAQEMLEALEPAAEAYGGPQRVADAPLEGRPETLSSRMIDRLDETNLEPPREAGGQSEEVDASAGPEETTKSIGSDTREEEFDDGSNGDEARASAPETAKVDQVGPPHPESERDESFDPDAMGEPLPKWSLVAASGGVVGLVVAVVLFVATGGGAERTSAGETELASSTSRETRSGGGTTAPAEAPGSGSEEEGVSATGKGEKSREKKPAARAGTPSGNDRPSIRVTTSQESATVYRDGERLGRTPYELQLAEEEASIALDRAGSRRRRVTVESEDAPTLAVDLERMEEERDEGAASDDDRAEASKNDGDEAGGTGGSEEATHRAEEPKRRETTSAEAESPSERRKADPPSSASGSSSGSSSTEEETTDQTFEQIAEDEDFSLD